MIEEEALPPQFYRYSQETAVSVFLPILQPYLPHSNSLFNRITAPHNLPSRHCFFGATFSPPLPILSSDPGTGTPPLPEIWTIVFADRSRHAESQIWMFNPLITNSNPLTSEEQNLLSLHTKATVQFLKNTPIPEAPGWPFKPILKFGCLHERITASLTKLCEPTGACPYVTHWRLWNVSTSAISSNSQMEGQRERRTLPEGYSIARVPDDQIDIVISTSSIPRQPETLRLQANVGIMNEEGKLVAWGYLGIDGSLVTLYVLPEYRGKGLATQVAVHLLGRLNRGEFSDLGCFGKSGWVHSDVKVGNEGSEGVMRSLGAKIGWTSSYIWVDCEKFE
ncbi:hypothetical protein G7Y89_g12365 [Cudoniella acicularis]|uniref:N-acetyltransferase domain-containing protein n=1 Tax=Cudoniella acicularis TaxID=354080 RepID=A0A8H4RAK4_9HELO|nr:hypothetical protein G7Y89_g12365 [Cudoniella acicularis]